MAIQTEETVPPASAEGSPGDADEIQLRKIAFHAAVFLAAFLILFSRRPDAILNAQFWAEDGKYWYADAYHFGWRCLLMPLGGYLNTPSRLVGLFTLLFPFARAPLVMSICAILIEIVPVNFFLSSRFQGIPLRMRLAGALLYLALPNSYETHGILTNEQWRLALLACLVLLARPDDRNAWRVFDAAVLVTLTLAGPLGILLIPIAASLRWLRKGAGYDLHLVALIPGSVLQLVYLLLSGSRPSAPNGATMSRLIGIIGGQIFASLSLGMKTMLIFYVTGNRQSFLLVEMVAAIAGLAVVVYSLCYAPLELRLCLLFAGMVFAVALWSPLVDPASRTPQWEILQLPGLGNRYYFFPMLSFLACLFWMLGKPKPGGKIARYVAVAFLAALPFGIYSDWNYPAFKDFHFQEFAAQFEQAAPGTRVIIPLNPTGWRMDIVKK